MNREAQWTAATDVTPEHDAAAEATAFQWRSYLKVALYESLTGMSD